MIRARGLAAAVGLALLAGCATKPPVPAPSPQPRPLPRPPGIAVAPSAATFMAREADRHLLAVQASELVLERAMDERTRGLATVMVHTHRGLAAQLSFAGRRLNLLPDARLSPDAAAQLEALRGSQAMAADYRRLMGRLQRAALAENIVYARDGASPTLRPVARNAERSLRDALEIAGW